MDVDSISISNNANYFPSTNCVSPFTGAEEKERNKSAQLPSFNPPSTLSFHKEKTNFQVVVVVGGISGWF